LEIIISIKLNRLSNSDRPKITIASPKKSNSDRPINLSKSRSPLQKSNSDRLISYFSNIQLLDCNASRLKLEYSLAQWYKEFHRGISLSCIVEYLRQLQGNDWEIL
jgi:hypothetical protein